MVIFKIEAPNEKVKYIKDVDAANETITFTEKQSEVNYSMEEGFFADSEFDYLMFHFKKNYPELEYMKKYSTYLSKDLN